jgi:hypothetical protein
VAVLVGICGCKATQRDSLSDLLASRLTAALRP